MRALDLMKYSLIIQGTFSVSTTHRIPARVDFQGYNSAIHTPEQVLVCLT